MFAPVLDRHYFFQVCGFRARGRLVRDDAPLIACPPVCGILPADRRYGIAFRFARYAQNLSYLRRVDPGAIDRARAYAPLFQGVKQGLTSTEGMVHERYGRS